MGLELDDRQRAMLEEMHVRVWWPGTDARDRLAEPVGKPSTSVAAPPVSDMPVTQSPAGISTPDAPRNVLDGLGGMDWPALARTVAGCTACQLCVGRKAAVFQPESAPRQTDWLVVGEPPDEQEERAGAPFAGPSGELMDNMLRAVGLARSGAGSSGARLTNIVKCRPAAVRNPQADELAICSAYLRREIALTQPKLILAMGRIAAQVLAVAGDPELASRPFGKLRGQVYRYQGVPVVVSHDPKRLLRAPQDKAGAWADLCLAQRVVRG